MTPPADAESVDDWEAHWSSYGEAAQDNPAQRYRHQTVLRELGVLASEARVLDIGSGQGDLLVDVRLRAPSACLLGLELSAEGIRQGQEKIPDAQFFQVNLLEPPEISGEYSGWATHAICSEVLEHLDDPVTFLRNAMAFLTRSCRLVVTVPGGPMSAYDRHIGHRRHFDVELLRSVLTEAGFEVLNVRRAGFPVFNLYKLLVIARGERLIADVSSGSNGGAGRVAKFAMGVFDRIFRFAAHDSRWGWQLVATAVPARS